MNLRQIPAQKIRLALKLTGGITAGLFIIGAIIKFLIPVSLVIPYKALSDPCLSTYTLNWSSPSTYTVTCGSVNSAQWTVKDDTCWYLSPVISVGGNPGDPDRIVDITVRINGSGNLDHSDKAWIYTYVNGVLGSTYSCNGDTINAVFFIHTSVIVPAGGTYQIKIKLKDDAHNEFWLIKNGDITACVNLYNPLPVQFASFKGTANKKNVQLRWSTACEMNNAYFTLERSADAKNFFELAKVNGAGTSSTAHTYSFSDDTPLAGTSYYRLNQTDLNGITKTYKVISVLFSGNGLANTSILVSPNPFSDSFTAQFKAAEKAEAIVNILSTNGVTVYSENILTEKGNNIFRFSTPSAFKEGTYTLQVLNAKGVVLGNTKVICRKDL